MGAGNVLGKGGYYSFGDRVPGEFAGDGCLSSMYVANIPGNILANDHELNRDKSNGYDAAYMNWTFNEGGVTRRWQIPTLGDMQDLIDSCIHNRTISVITIDNQKYVKVYGKPNTPYSNNYILLPMMGMKEDGSVVEDGISAYIRINYTDDVNKDGKAKNLKFYLSSTGSLVGESHETEKYVGIPIRPVFHHSNGTLQPTQGN